MRGPARGATDGPTAAGDAFLTTAEACALLGVKPQTLYAYVSRGQLRAVARPETRASCYLKEEIDALRARSLARSGHGPAAAGAMRWGEPILESAITCLHQGMIHYRGARLDTLLEAGHCFENVAELLWSGDLPVHPVRWGEPEPEEGLSGREDKGTLLRMGAAGLVRGLFRKLSTSSFPAPAVPEDDLADELLDVSLLRARWLILLCAREIFGPSRGGQGARGVAPGIASRLAPLMVGRKGNTAATLAAASKLLDAALIVSADHELNASTFAARVAASTGADIRACMFAGLAAFSGRHHGLASVLAHGRVLEFLHGPRREAEAGLRAALVTGHVLPGFGHRLFPKGDPRAQLLLDRCRAFAETQGGTSLEAMAAVDAYVAFATALGAPPPNLDLGLVAVSFVLGLPEGGASSLFLLGRMAGWTAHVLEQRGQGFLLRPRARYVGRPPARAGSPQDARPHARDR